MASKSTIEELTLRNVAIIAEMEKAAGTVRTRGDRVAERLATWVGSWTFLLAQTAILACWILLNLTAWVKHWDPYPFILLNLMLGCQAAYAAPILMISQNRQARLSERRNHLDLQINMLAEQETTEILRLLHLLCDRSGVPRAKTDRGQALEEDTKHAEIVRQIQGEIEEQADDAGEVLQRARDRESAGRIESNGREGGTDL